jgi:hypothetical protein
MVKHLLVLGATGAGKTETLLRLAWTLAKSSDAPVWYLDGKGDSENAQRFAALMQDAGRTSTLFPSQAYDGWRGGPGEIYSRLMEVIDYTPDGPAAWYRDIARTTLQLVCNHPDGPPRSSSQALSRMDLVDLQTVHQGSSPVKALTEEHVGQVRLRYEAFFGQCHGLLDGSWAWEDATAGYVLLSSLTQKEEVAGIARFLMEDFAHYFSARKPREQLCMMIVDEFSSLAGGSSMAARIEQARGYQTCLVLAPQVVEGMGGEIESARIRGSVGTTISHQVNTPEDIVRIAGTRKVPRMTTHFAEDGVTRRQSVRIEDEPKIDHNQVRSLDPGVAYIISNGRAMRARILRAATISGQLPAAHVAPDVSSTPATAPEKRQATDVAPAADEFPF